MMNEYANYTTVKSRTDVTNFETGVNLWKAGSIYTVFEIIKSDRLAEIQTENGGNLWIDLNDEDFEFIEEETE